MVDVLRRRICQVMAAGKGDGYAARGKGISPSLEIATLHSGFGFMPVPVPALAMTGRGGIRTRTDSAAGRGCRPQNDKSPGLSFCGAP